MLLKFAYDDFIADRKFNNTTQANINSYKYMIKPFIEYCIDEGAINVEDVNRNHLKNYLVMCQEQNKKPNTINTIILRAKAFFNYLVDEGIVKENIAKKIKVQKVDIKIDTFTDNQINQMLAFYRIQRKRHQSYSSYRNLLIVLVLLGTGIRRKELIMLKWDDVDFKNQTLQVHGKSRKYETVFLTDKLTDEPEVTLELDTIELLDKELGERVWLIYEPLEMEFETRILSQIKQFVNGELRTVKVILGNTLPKTTTDILVSQKVEIDENKKITRSKFEQTNDRTMSVETINESIYTLELRADGIDANVKDNKDNISKLEIRATGIEANVSDNSSNISTLKIQAGQIESKVSGLDSRMGQAESSITQTNNRITLETRGDNLISSINVAPYGVSINADKINLNGAVIASGTITGQSSINIATDATIGNNLYLGQRGGCKSVNFGSGSNITYNGSYMELSSSNVRLNGSSNELNGYNTIYGTLNIPSTTNLIGVVRAESSGIGISVSGNGKTLYVKVNGSTVGSVQLT